MGIFGKRSSTSAQRPRWHAMLNNEYDDNYIHRWLAWPASVVELLVGCGFIVLGIITTHFFWYNLFLKVSPYRTNGTFQITAHVIGMILGCAGILFLLNIIFKTGRHYTDRQAQNEHESLGLMKSTGSRGGDFKLMVFQGTQDYLPYLLFTIDILTTVGGFISWLGTPMSFKTTDSIEITVIAFAGALIVAIVVYFMGIWLLIKSFHLFEHGNNELYRAKKIRGIAQPGGARTVSAPPSGSVKVAGPPSSASQSIPAHAASRGNAQHLPPMPDLVPKTKVHMTQEGEY